MLQAFQKNMVRQTLLVVAAAVLVWLRPLIDPPALTDTDTAGILWALAAWPLADLPRLAVVIALLLSVGEALWLNLLLVRRGLTPQTSLLPTLLFLLMTGATSATLSPMLFVNAILIAYTDQLMLRGTLLTIGVDRVCAATALIGLASLFYTPAWLLLVPYLLVAVSYRLYSWRDWTAMLLGLAAPYVPLLAVLYLVPGWGIGPWWSFAWHSLTDIHPSLGATTPLHTVANLVLVAVALGSIVTSVSVAGEKPVVWQKNATVVMLLALGAAVMVPFGPLFPIDTQALAIPFAFTGTLLFTPRRPYSPIPNRAARNRRWLLNALFVVTIAAALC